MVGQSDGRLGSVGDGGRYLQKIGRERLDGIAMERRSREQVDRKQERGDERCKMSHEGCFGV